MENGKGQTTTTIFFFLLYLLFYTEKVVFVRKYIWKNLVYIFTFVLQFFHMAGYCKCSNKTSTPI